MEKYYLLSEDIIIKKDINNKDEYYQFIKGGWIIGKDMLIKEYFNNLNDSLKIIEISYDIAQLLISRKAIAYLKKKWTKEAKFKIKDWYKDPGWLAKYVSSSFKLYGIDYTIYPDDIGLSFDGYDQGFMETFQKEMDKDLKNIGATDIHHVGFLD